ncbi:FAD-dependent monooxygenase [Pseudosulfitobacter pseudonitzschiae]|uniref:FAD-dependent monooxygenase n=1 Tax=Pseudosulfitobacter pseudonitzschiae TaxID=1402135 RepID=UPI001AF6C9E2|nr:FAD-dependent monooxygenase [Pseudosulfitobacter pseudonitzschiae]MBM1815345.1 FAD-dependent monooxygenase [Pseudosulfitobacter pseudonitzschiae]MBM1832336.1 FAD-dependent monooxygenase [Pseudosulfitobacter pseudonitzschiae]MBM1837204.1 FAD-dependent monooxygenase [Pseudosulfitobacter pseudonitzschiae]MBM1842050.1 FAD-dependent monooxygenase [Pseudosulfitobacter pseudonitzschiae]MBM1846918.1 FAD-dependent monooxygenase [Pseudosulfitobacter pseudonitzschiae]
MQYHLNGYTSGDPHVAQAIAAHDPAQMPARVDVLIVGCGPAGLTLAAQVAQFPDISVAIADQKDGPLQVGQADGISCRSIEMFNTFGFAEDVLREGYWVNETTFWKPDPDHPAHITRTQKIDDVEPGLSEFPHVILNQARVHDFYLRCMANGARRLQPHYGRTLDSLTVGDGTQPVTARFQGPNGPETVQARYVVGCDGARSTVRRQIGRRLEGAAANQAWGVMDVLAVIDFPDVRLKSVIQSEEAGSVLIIPREGGYMVRMYIELDKLGADERAAGRNITIEQLIAAAGRILHPYTLDVKDVAWWSVYDIGQRLCDRFEDDSGHIFIAGDACHTHSPKAGQGMNVSMGDTFNLGWKLAAVLRGQSDASLLRTYSDERQQVAQDLIDFDRDFARIFSAPPQPGNAAQASMLQEAFIKAGRFTAGMGVQYRPSMICSAGTHQALAAGLPVGQRFHSAPVVRLGDARPMELGHVIQADGRWRLFAFAGANDTGAGGGALHRLCTWAQDAVQAWGDGDTDAVIDLRAVMPQGHRDLDLMQMPSILRPAKGRFGLIDYEKVFCADPAHDIFDMRGVNRATGCVVIVRPDQYVADVLPMGDTDALAAFFDGVFVARA